MFSRTLGAVLAQSSKSVLLLGPRQTGKSTLLAQLQPERTINLSDEAVFLEFASDPSRLRQVVERQVFRRRPWTVMIDEVQRIPSLLNTVQALVDGQPKLRFLLSGSSARKLKRGSANLLPGRLHVFHLGCLTAFEAPGVVGGVDALRFGLLPGVFTTEHESDKRRTLRSYAATYLKEEIQAEALTRNLEGFARFIRVSGEWSGETVDLSKWAVAASASRQSVSRWVEVLEDTLLVRRIGPFAQSATRRLVQHPRYYYFDCGVLNGLLGNFEASADRIGNLFEHLVVNQIFDCAAASDIDVDVTTYRTEGGAEVDFIVRLGGVLWAVEVKSGRRVGAGDMRGLESFRDYYGKSHRSLVVCRGEEALKVKGVDVLPLGQALAEMGLSLAGWR